MQSVLELLTGLLLSGTILGVFLPLFWLFIPRHERRGRTVCSIMLGWAISGTALTALFGFGLINSWILGCIFDGIALVVAIAAARAFSTPQSVERQAWLERRAAVGVVGLALADLGLWAYALDDYVAISQWSLFTIVLCLVAAGWCLPLAQRYRSPTAVTLVALFMVVAVAQHICDFTPVKPYHRFYSRIASGMSEADVLAAMQSEFPAKGYYPQPISHHEGDHLFFLLNPAEGNYNAENVTVILQNGRVVNKRYTMD